MSAGICIVEDVISGLIVLPMIRSAHLEAEHLRSKRDACMLRLELQPRAVDFVMSERECAVLAPSHSSACEQLKPVGGWL